MYHSVQLKQDRFFKKTMKKSNHGNNCVDLEAEQVSEATQYGSLEEKADYGSRDMQKM